MAKTGKRLAAALLALAMVAGFASMWAVQTAYAAREVSFNTNGRVSGLVYGNIALDEPFSFKPEDIIGDNDEMMECLNEYGDYTVSIQDMDDYSDLTKPLSVDSDGLCTCTIPYANNYLGSMVRIVIEFPCGGGEKVFASEYFDVVGDLANGGKIKCSYYHTYNGKPHTPPVTVFFHDEELDEETDYDVVYKNNVNAGTAMVTVTGAGEYTGTLTKTFWIKKAKNPLKIKKKTATVKYSKLKNKSLKLAVTKVIAFKKKAGDAKIYKKLSGVGKISINKTTGKVTVKKGLKKGTYKVEIKVKAKGNSNYKKSAWETVTSKIVVS